MSQELDPAIRRVAVVTGGASGIGPAVAAHLAKAGHAVALLDRQGDLVRGVAADLCSGGAQIIGIEVDVTDRQSVHESIARVRAELGSITIVVTSAGIDVGVPVPVTEITPEQWDRLIAVNLTGTFTCIQAAVPDMQAAGWGRIVTISSSSAQSGAPERAHYVASKGGVIALTKALAYELAPQGITVNTIPPSVVDTPMAHAGVKVGTVPDLDILASMVPLRRNGTPDDIAATVAFLCSDGGSYITGQVIGVNGGMYI
ncbi:SDR family NAD(P)-dependent oxidoreductase [Mycolicibacterium fortuitum]|uniref:3-oxoacyl-[acyl-carrier-protein] reductase MabA n=2 Tax=Mycolicibacterium fortuitum TaxID=1766 RepID=A0A378UA85_MYCFO|nr:SDR family NAD(P)-dependent oxidoreductase [Mycolicibacterium fortuitum]AIY46712.1 3-oxoacyl-[acyl-carrier protein] reductase [Mycobacterium sp. VKM Ac-1817D]CRL79535.1 dehydrogenase [Mycolicibacter nonchromogenicus]EJZ09789.1 short-chain dehydrogenase/reductase SDR [Mycolicibacterium fortuitum subsp. fortuitum DSM 46621 = ATCC 6841 = JCM 6387]WEV30158.1 SDR family oxidoreductase [Mycolicibacterium fortuitum]CRL57599.1 dehydrogenase [Mycolicibacterium fortuitum subsp. fortuitum DSM 46621 = 